MAIRSEAAEPEGTAARPAPLRLTGGCHCGNLALTFEPARDPAELAVRACGCSFCRRHGARTVSDPQGRAEFVVHDPSRLSRYSFALGTAQFLVCRTCGVYVGAILADAGSAYATININALLTPGVFARATVPVSYDRESARQRQARRRALWTPATVVQEADACQAAGPGEPPCERGEPAAGDASVPAGTAGSNARRAQ